MPSVKIGTSIRVPEEALVKWVEENLSGARSDQAKPCLGSGLGYTEK